MSSSLNVKAAAAAAAAALVSVASAQQLGTTPDSHPGLTTYKCTTGGGCVEQATSVVIDWNWHWLRDANYNSCTTSSGLNQTLCGTEAECGANCYIEGVSNYTDQGVTTSGSALTLTQNVLRNGVYQNSSPRVYLLAPDGENYEGLKLLGQEISFDVDASTLVCGENGAFYLSEMDLSGGRSQYNAGGAAYGAGYCDAQCPTGSWFNGSVNVNNYGSCCNEMDLWEANANATALTPHPCNVTSVGGCTGGQCGSSGDCDKNGCGFNPYALGQHSYYGAGAGFTVDTLEPITVTTQFVTDDGTTTGTLTEIRRQYIQNGVVISNAVASSSSGWAGQQSITDDFCDATSPEGKRLGGLATMGEALGRGMVLVASVWNDASGNMTWLDSGNSGPCSAAEGNPSVINSRAPYTGATFSNIKWGDIGSTTNGKGKPPVSSSSSSSSSSTITGLGSSTSTPSSVTSPTLVSPTGCTQTLCEDRINSCGLAYGGCYPACSGYPKPTFTDPGCPSVSTTKPISTTTKPMSSTTTISSTSSTKKTTTSSAAPPGQTHWGQCGGIGWTGPKSCQSPWSCNKQNDYYSQCL